MMITADALAPGNIAMSIAFVFIIILMRYLSVEFMIRRSGKGKEEKNAFFYMLPRGLATAVLATLLLAAGIEGSRDFIVYAVSVIVLTIIVMTAGVLQMGWKRDG